MKRNIRLLVSDAVESFVRASELAKKSISQEDINVEYLCAPHNPPAKLPSGKMAVYMFFYQGNCLKVGKVGPNSNARYISQHYNHNSSNSNLAKSVLKNSAKLNLMSVDETNISKWIKENTSRVNLLLDRQLDYPTLNLLEAFMQCRFKPMFEG